ncbi:DegT/DnrJ/EryC1/StrS family aminotransferase [Paenibacillus naphthalenovorans]|uniref:Aminotransferase DegT n=1 Tax=Paenibacillus naphthalenovorans TaxID=162209 RepID=A0A0U2VYA6_9BACL|nr:DegT/DnrJ/EryC1/StrS family aminotransferase [Paenibacillus naphthalenovorans]ALS24471.1 aminotransferase DegT [Paenibacillus naphthalenovorans]
MGKIPVFSLQSEIESLKSKLMDSIENVLLSGHFIMGENVRAFEEEVSAYLGVKYAVALNSGTDALIIALKAVGIGEGDEVITTPFTFFATAEAIHQVGAKAVFVDIDPRTFNMNPSLIEQAITPRTKAILPVHIFGRTAEMDEILAMARSYRLKVIEDVAQAFGAEYKGKKAGTLGAAGCFSFFPTKNLGAYGDGGLIATDDEEIAEYSRMLRIHGSKKKYHNETFGYNSRLDELQAAILRVKLPYIDQWNNQRIQIANNYNEWLAGIPGIVLPESADFHRSSHVFHQYTIRILDGKRDRLQKNLADQGIDTMIYYPIPVHRLPVFQDDSISLPIAEQASSEVISLPIWPQMETETQKTVVKALESLLKI